MRICILVLLASAAWSSQLYEGFRDPAPEYSLSPYWFWNGRVTEAETRRQLAEMAKQNVRSAVVMNWAGLEPAYLSEEWWKQVGIALDAARAEGMTLNFADEYLWPSGQAWDWASLNREPSRVLQLHPEYRMKRLTCREIDGSVAPPELDAVPELVVAGTGEGSLTLLTPARRIAWTPKPGWKLWVYTAVPTNERNMRVDPLNPAAVRVFIGLVYEEYARRFPQHMGTTIRFFVADHEGAYGAPLPFTPALWDEFRKRRGYDLRPLMPIVAGSTPRAVQVRRDYMETISELYAESFVGQVTEWCTKHGVQHGHSDIEETMLLQAMWTGDMFRLWRTSTAPYIDALVERSRMPIDYQEALSVAHFEHHPLMVENQGLTGRESYWSLEKARLGTNMALLWGVNRLIPHYFEYDPTHIQYPPSWFLTQPQWPYFHHYADVARRGLYMNAQGRHEAQVAIYYPRESAFAGSEALFREGERSYLRWHNSMDDTQDYYSALQLELSRRGWEYHIVDSHYLAGAEIRGGKLRVGDEEFAALILPPMTHLAETSAAQIRKLRAQGGEVLEVRARPHKLFMDQLDYGVQIEVPEPVRNDLEPIFTRLRAIAPPRVEVLGAPRDHLFFSHRRTNDTEWFWAVNDSAGARTVRVRFPEAGAFEKWDAETGERHAMAAEGREVELSFGPWDAFFVVRTAAASAAPKLEAPARRVIVEIPRSGWHFTPEAPVRVPYATPASGGEPVWLAPERLANRNWWIAGPYPYGDHSGFFDVFPPEKGFDANDPAWKWTESPTAAVRMEKGESVHYAYVNVWSPEARRARAAVAAADSVKLWWNGKLAVAHHGHPPFVNLRDPWSLRPEIAIERGWNAVLLKVGPSRAGQTGFLFRLTDEQGNTLRDVVYARDRVLPEKKPQPVRLTIAAPPGTSGEPWVFAGDASAIPERPVAFAPRTTDFALESWTASTLAWYSGTALYETAFTLAQRPAGRLLLDLGEVGLAAEVWLNGKKVGERAWRPFVLDITDAAVAGENSLRVRVANSNAGASAQGDPIYERNGWGVKFTSERDRLQTLHPNGLEGPVRVMGAADAASLSGVRNQ